MHICKFIPSFLVDLHEFLNFFICDLGFLHYSGRKLQCLLSLIAEVSDLSVYLFSIKNYFEGLEIKIRDLISPSSENEYDHIVTHAWFFFINIEQLLEKARFLSLQ